MPHCRFATANRGGKLMPKLTEHQQQAVQSIDKHVLVSAGAGCGKTMVLVERYLEVLRRHPDAGVFDIIAVTFTRKAAEEMRSRLKARLREMLAQCSEHEQERQRWSRLLADVDRARIGTIHSLCESILKSHPAEAGVDPQFEVLDDLTRAELLQQCVDQAFRSLIEEAHASSALLLEYPIERLQEWVIQQLISVPQYKSARAALGGPQLENLRPLALSVVQQGRDLLVAGLSENAELRGAREFITNNPFGDSADKKNTLEQTRRDTLVSLEAFFRAAAANDGKTMAASLIALAAIPSPRNAGGAAGKPLRDAIKIVREAAAAFAEDCPLELTAQDDQAFEMLTCLLSLIDAALANFENAKKQAQKLDYNDLITKTHTLITAADSVARKQLSANTKAVLVDEFQDTNRSQAELLSNLCGDSARLFLIGDDKQSIYKFQGADVSTFNEWKSKINEQTHGLTGSAQLLDLSFSFRSHPAIVDFINRFFHFHFPVASGAQAAHRASHQALTPARQEAPDSSHVELVFYDALSGEGEKRDAEKARAVEARAIAAWILEKVGAQAPVLCKTSGELKPINFGDFAILVQANGDFSVIETALAAANIPFVTFAGGGFLDRQEILDIQNLLRWLSNPTDDHALLAVLRSPFFSINDGIIYKLFLDGAGSLWQRLQSTVKNGDEEFACLIRPVALLRQLLQDSHGTRVSDLVRTAIMITGFDISLLAVPNGRQKSRNAWKMAWLAGQYNHLTLTQFVQALDTMRDIGAGKQTDAPLSAENAVKLMTIHKSKGLEFSAVILPVLGRKIHLGTPKLLVHRQFGIALDTSRSKDDPRPSYYRAASLLNAEMDSQEKKRLLYVAMTRARDWLVMFAEQNTRSDVSFRLWLREALGLQEPEASARAGLVEGEHYTTRYVDETSVAEWAAAGTDFGGTVMSDAELQALSAEIGFDLISPHSVPEERPASYSHISWSAMTRVTATEESEPHATVLGTLFHAAMQRLVLNGKQDDDTTLDLLAAQELFVSDAKLRIKLVTQCRRFLQTYNHSKLHEMLCVAQRFLPEVGYTTFDEAGGSADKRPDLIFQDNEEHFHVVDFKTDKLEPDELPTKVNEHSAQVLEYAADFQKLTGHKARAWLYFADRGLLEEVTAAGFEVSRGGQLKLPFSVAPAS
jgi:ATP-dependent helicase/nuclease subunit A